MTVFKYQTQRFYTEGHRDSNRGILEITLPAIPGVTVTSSRDDTAPTLPTIRYRKPNRIHGAAAASMADRKISAIADAICEARAAMMPAVTVAMEARG